ncbi:MAG: hypothetical protein QW706_09685 [Candidatus Nezhaarchaeales archaeon]
MTELERLYRAVKITESNDNPLAIRFEEHFMRRVNERDKAFVRARVHVYAFTDTIKSYLAFSVGRCQFLIYNLYFIDSIYDYLLKQNLMPVRIPLVVSDSVEFELFKLFISERMRFLYLKLLENVKLSEQDLRLFSKFWNGSEAYYNRLVRHLR